jgi:hypothetical protein
MNLWGLPYPFANGNRVPRPRLKVDYLPICEEAVTPSCISRDGFVNLI